MGVRTRFHLASVSLRQRCDDIALTLAKQFSLTTMESLKNGLQLHSQVTPLWPMRMCCKHSCSFIATLTQTDSDAWCKRALKKFMNKVHLCSNTLGKAEQNPAEFPR